MSPGINPEGQQFVNAIDQIQNRLTTAQLQISSGKQVNEPSDAPDEISPILQLHAQISQNTAMQNNLGISQSTVNAAESALSNSVTLLQQASTLATEGTGVSQTADTRTTLAQSVGALLQQMVSNSQTTVNGYYVFSGDQNQTQLYQLDSTSPTGVDRLAVATNTDLVQGPGGVQIAASLTANTIFDNRNADDSVSSNNVFAALAGLQTALQNNDVNGIDTAITNLQSASSWMNDQLAYYGNVQDQLASAVNSTQSDNVQLQTQLSGLQDADQTSAITELTQAQTQLQAALAAQARMPQTTLFDVLPAA